MSNQVKLLKRQLPSCFVEADEMGIIGSSYEHLCLLDVLKHVATTDAELLLVGETGVGKELYAKFTHVCSSRQGEFVAVNCAAIPDSLFENELFGHAAGAYTDAAGTSVGLIELAEAGTLFFDEVDQLSHSAQVKLLRFLQEREYRRLGESHIRTANVRIITATNGNLEDLVANKTFRADLYYRINVVTKQVPALRERRSDIALLANFFLGRFCSKYGRKLSLTERGIRVLQSLDWPGNIRQLENTIRSLICELQETQICEEVLLRRFGNEKKQFACNFAKEIEELTKLPFKAAKQKLVEEFEIQYLSRMLELTDGNLCQAARACGMDPRSFRRLVAARGISRDPNSAGNRAELTALQKRKPR